MYHFFDLYPEYGYVFICEYDCSVNMDILPVIEAMAAQQLEFVGEPVRTPIEAWHWAQFARPYYTIEIAGRLLCCAAFSRDFARELQAARRDHTQRSLLEKAATAEAKTTAWPNNEAFVGSEIVRLSVAEAPLSSFGDTSHFDWAPPYLEIELPNLTACGIVHPVLDAPRFFRSILRLGWDAEDLFRKDSHLQRRFEQCDPAYVVSNFLPHFVQAKNWVAVDQLRLYAREHAGEQARALFNVAKGKTATQSSTCQWSRSLDVAQDAAGAINGRITGLFSFHTDREEAPWWCVDLQAIYPVREICIYNRMDQTSRSRSLMLSFSSDMAHWHMLPNMRERILVERMECLLRLSSSTQSRCAFFT